MKRLLLPLLLAAIQPALAAPPRIVAAEAVYADIARQIGGPGVDVTAILTNPATDPHLFEPGPAVARALTTAQIVIYNGAGYDPWIRPLIAATGGGGVRRVIGVSDLTRSADGNPHLWYAPGTIPALATAIAGALTGADPANAALYAHNLAKLRTSLALLNLQIGAVRAGHAGQAVTATEPVFGLMLNALGLRSLDPAFQTAVMNDTEPSPAEIAGIEADLRSHRARALIRNIQTDDDLTRRLVAIAQQSNLPIVEVTETEPPNTTYQRWVAAQLTALDQALSK